MTDFALAHAVHVLAVVVWIGGVAFVTLALLPALLPRPAKQRMREFNNLERRFASQARICVLLAGLSGLWMVWRADMWWRFTHAQFWWMHAMVLLWGAFTAMLFVIEPLFLHSHLESSADPERDFARMRAMHRVLLAASLVTIVGAAAGSHGL